MIKVKDIAFVRFGAPDLDQMERFLGDFGLVVTARTDDVIYARGTDPSPYLHVTERGEPGFRGVAFEAASAADLDAVGEARGCLGRREDRRAGRRSSRALHRSRRIQRRSGARSRAARAAPGSLCVALQPRYARRPRQGTLQRVQAGPSCVKRLGHAVLRVADFRRSEAWYKSRFGFVSSDEVFLGPEENVITAFLRCDRGHDYTDHHTLLCVGIGPPGFDHAAFEVEDIDAVMLGHDHLKQAGYVHHTGVGRHILGSQVFDYWKDPWGHVVEHFTDGDLLNDQNETGLHGVAGALGTQWGKFAP